MSRQNATLVYHVVDGDEYLTLLGGSTATSDKTSFAYFKADFRKKVWIKYGTNKTKIATVLGSKPAITLNGSENEIQAHIFSGLTGSASTGVKLCQTSLHTLKINNETVVQTPSENKGNVIV